MKTTKTGGNSRKPNNILTRAIIIAGLLFSVINGLAQVPPPGKYIFPPPLDSWSFSDTNTWTSDLGFAPVSFTNLDSMLFGYGTSLVLDTNIPASLQYNVTEANGTNNLVVDVGSVTFWFAPNWSSANDVDGGLGPQEWGRLLEVGSYTADSSYGWWSMYVDPAGTNIYFSAQTNNSSATFYAISTPIDWTTNYWHFITLTYSTTNVALYLDGHLATNSLPGLTVWPGPDVLANGFYVGSDSNGTQQAHGEFDDLKTYNVVLTSNQVLFAFNGSEANFLLNPDNWQYMQANVSSAPSNPSTNYYQAITGSGSLQSGGSASSCVSSTNIWITNVVASVAAGGTMNLTFTIEGGSNGVPYDVFANSVLDFSTNTIFAWSWMGQGYQCNIYTLTNLPSTTCFLILGTPQDTDLDGLTDAYEKLVSKTNPFVPDTDGDGIPDAWEVLLGLNPLVNDNAQPSSRSNYSYDPVDWLNGISGIRNGSITNDPEGNVNSVSQ